MIELLLSKGASASMPDADGQLPREYAALSGHLQVPQLTLVMITQGHFLVPKVSVQCTTHDHGLRRFATAAEQTKV